MAAFIINIIVVRLLATRLVKRGLFGERKETFFAKRTCIILATSAVTFAIIETFTKVRELKRELVELHQETDKEKQKAKMQHFGDVLTEIVMPDLQTSETESSLEINFIIGKIKHTVKRVRREEGKK
jgi:hypothetical protein